MDNDIASVVLLGVCVFFFQAEDGIRDLTVTGVQTCALPILRGSRGRARREAAGVLRPADAVHVGSPRLDPASRPAEAEAPRVDHGRAAVAQDRKSVV